MEFGQIGSWWMTKQANRTGHLVSQDVYVSTCKQQNLEAIAIKQIRITKKVKEIPVKNKISLAKDFN